MVVILNHRLSRTLARARPVEGCVEISPNLLRRAPGVQREVLVHELAHLAVARLHPGVPRPHGAEWCALMRAAGFVPRATLRVRIRACSVRLQADRDRARSVRLPDSARVTSVGAPPEGHAAAPEGLPGSEGGQADRAPRYPYEHRCPVCHFVRYARRPVPAWRCAACAVAGLPGELVVTRRPDTPEGRRD